MRFMYDLFLQPCETDVIKAGFTGKSPCLTFGGALGISINFLQMSRLKVSKIFLVSCR